MFPYTFPTSYPSCPPADPPPLYRPHSPTPPDKEVTIHVKCPHPHPTLSSCSWCLQLYSLTVGGMGAILAMAWIAGHAYVLQLTQDEGLKIQR